MELNYSDPDYIKAMSYNLSGDWSNAKKAFEGLLKKYPESTFIMLLLGNVEYSLGNLEESVAWYDKALDADPEFGYAYYKRGVCYYRMGKLQNALHSFVQVVEMKNQSHAMASYFVGLINLFLGRDDAAMKGFSQFQSESAESMIANYYLAQLMIKRKQFSEALDLLSSLVKQTPDFAEVHYMLGVVQYGLHNNMEAIKCFRRALEINPEDERSRTKLTMLTDVQWP